MKLFIPELGTRLVLAKPWHFTVHNEKRNATFVKLVMKIAPVTKYHRDDIEPEWDSRYPLGGVFRDMIKTTSYRMGPDGKRDVPTPHTYYYYAAERKSLLWTLPKGTELIVDRIYIRAGSSDFSSVTFKLKVDNRTARFFAKLPEVNRIEL